MKHTKVIRRGAETYQCNTCRKVSDEPTSHVCSDKYKNKVRRAVVKHNYLVLRTTCIIYYVNCIDCEQIVCSASKHRVRCNKCTHQYSIKQSQRIIDRTIDKEHTQFLLATKEHMCIVCGDVFVKAVGEISVVKKYCSVKCVRRKANRTKKLIHGYSCTAYGRAKKNGALRQEIKPIKVFEANKWKCMRCGIKTPKELKGTNEDNAPTIDHIIPLSKGGAHVYGNLQCLCRKCNCMEKVDKIETMQLPLFFQKVNQRTKEVTIQVL